MLARGVKAGVVQTAQSSRALSVVAWGRNVEGQCAHSDPVLTEPTTIESLALSDSNIVAVSAGRVHSSAVTADGQLLTWGSGKAGKLGHGNADTIAGPTCVESLVSRAHIAHAALGHSHSLFLDSKGALWSCGENKEGQCGYGTSLETIAQQRRQEWAIGASAAGFPTSAQAAMAGPGKEVTKAAGGGGGATSWQEPRAPQTSPSSGWQSWLQPIEQHTSRQEEAEEAKRMFAAGLSLSADSGARASSGGLAAIMGTSGETGGLMPGQTHTPIRIGRDAHPLISVEGLTSTEGSTKDHVFTNVSAGRYFSAAVSADGEVFTWGSGFGGELGHEGASWVTSAQQVDGVVREAIAENGGAKKVVTGEAGFCACLTLSGRVVAWGSLPGLPAPGNARRSGGVCVTEVMGLPPMMDVAAGHSHLVMTDGERVWAMGSWLSRAGERVLTQWGLPEEQVRDATTGIISVSAGSQASGAVTGDGKLWMWGRLLAVDGARSLWQRSGTEGGKKIPEGEWTWAGMGADRPQIVPGLNGVQAVHFGAAHALAVLA